MAIAIVTDSTADLPPDLATSHGITVIPLEVRLGSRVYRDGIDLHAGEFFRRVAEENLAPLTSQPPLGAFVGAYRALLRRHDGIISIHISSAFSGTYDAACLASRSLAGADITVIDSGSFTLGLGLQVLSAARALRNGSSKEEVLALLADCGRSTQIIGVLDTLDFLRLGGRISKVSHLLGTLLKVKPVIRVAGGQAVSIGRNRRREQAVESILSYLDPLIERGRTILGVAHTMAVEEAGILRRGLMERFGPVELMVEAGPVVGSHVGPRALAVALA